MHHVPTGNSHQFRRCPPGILNAHLTATVDAEGLLARNNAGRFPANEIAVLVCELELCAADHICAARPELLIIANRRCEFLRAPTLVDRFAHSTAQHLARGFRDRPFWVGVIYELLAIPLFTDKFCGTGTRPLLCVGINYIRDPVGRCLDAPQSFICACLCNLLKALGSILTSF